MSAAAAAAAVAGPSQRSIMDQASNRDGEAPEYSAQVPAGAAYAARCWQTLDQLRAGGQKNLRLPRQDRLKQRALGDQVRRVGFPFMRPLEGHISCVNALAFSKDGRWLASGGDDMRVQIRDMYQDIDSDRSDVFVTLPGHRANIFTLSWSCNGQHLFSGGMDGRVHQYDLHSLSNLAKRPRLSLEPGQHRRTLWARQPSIHPSAVLSAPANPTGLEFLLGTTPAIREVSAHPYNPALVLACTQNGLLTMNDVRLPAPGIVGCARLSARRGLFALAGRSFSGVQWRPLASDGNTFAVCISTGSNRVDAANINVKAGTRLYDARMCFRSSNRSGGMDAVNMLDTAGILNDDNAVVLYDSVLERFDRRSDDEVCAYFAVADGVNVRFDPTGQFLVSDATGFKPIIYEVGQSQPIAVCEAKGYATRCTTKHGSFGRFGTDLTTAEEPPSDGVQDARDERGPAVREAFTLPKVERDGLYYVTGSDDFRGYGWAIPSVDSLVARREAVEELSILRGERPIDGLYFVSKNGAPVWVPRLNKPAFTLDGAQSITNTTLAHPHLPLIATSGIERLVRLYSPLPFSTHDELPEDGSLSVPLLRPGLTRQIGKKPALPTGANDERDSIDIARSFLSHHHPETTASQGMRANDRLLRTRQLCRQGDIGDASTIAQFDEYLLEEEKDRREKRRRLAGAARSAAASGGRGGGGGRGRGAKEEVREEVGAEGEGEELFRAKPDIMYSLRRIFKEAQEGKGKAASAGARAGATGRLSSTAMTKIGSNSTDGGATSAGSSSRGINLTPPKAKRPWRRSADRPVFVGQEEGEEEQTGVGVGDRGVEVHDRGRTSHEDSQEDEDEDEEEDEMDGSTSASSDRSDDVGTDTVHQSDDDDDDNEKEEEEEGGGPDWSQNWVLRAARRLGLQQLSAHRPARLAGGVWEVRHSATPPTGAVAGVGARGFEIVPSRFRRWEMEMGGDDDDDEEEGEEAAAAEEMFLSPDEDDSEDDDGEGEGEGEGRPRAAVAPLPDRDADGLTEYERWMRQDLPRIRSSGRAEGMDLDEDDDDEEEDDEDDEEEEDDYEGGAGGGGDVGADEEEDYDDDDADDGAVAYRRLGRDRP